MLKPLILGQLRHMITVGATLLATKGWIDESMVQSLVGIVLYVATAAWSAYDKRSVM